MMRVQPIDKRCGKVSCISLQHGFSLVEVLVTLVIMSIGMLSIAGLYVKSMQAGRTSMFHHHAVTLASDVADRVRANPTAGAAYQHANTALGADGGCVDGGINCTSAAMAANDIFLWQNQARTTLPNGSIAIVFAAAVAGAPPTYEITVAWNEPGITATSTPPTYVITIPVLPI
jgi:type IV pilus assembly protein PilV